MPKWFTVAQESCILGVMHVRTHGYMTPAVSGPLHAHITRMILGKGATQVHAKCRSFPPVAPAPPTPLSRD